MMTQFQKIKNYPNYLITNQGEVISLGKKKNKTLKSRKNKGGYSQLDLTREKKAKTTTIHRLVAQAFIPNPKNKPEVNHINGIKTDNRVENLEWMTCSENNLHAFKELGKKANTPGLGKFGKLHPRSKPINQLKEGKIIRRWDCAKQAEREMGFQSTLISCVLKGKRKFHNGFQWEYVKE